MKTPGQSQDTKVALLYGPFTQTDSIRTAIHYEWDLVLQPWEITSSADMGLQCCSVCPLGCRSCIKTVSTMHTVLKKTEKQSYSESVKQGINNFPACSIGATPEHNCPVGAEYVN